MTAALLKQVRAVQKFLGSIRHLPSFKEAKEKQAELLSKKFASQSIPVEAAAELVGLLDASIWEDRLDALKAAVSIESASEKKNTPLQDYVAISQYLTAALWKSLSEDRRDIALEKLCRHCQLLGLSNASEMRQGMILCLVFDLEGKLLGTQQWSVTLKEKGKVQKFLKQPKQSPFLAILPRTVEACPPELLTRACRDETRLECPVSYEDLVARAKDWPMRSTHRFAQQQPQLPVAGVPGNDEGALIAKMGQFMAGFVQGQSAQESVSLPGLKIFPRAAKEAKTASVPVLALGDKKVESEARTDQAPVVAQLQEELKPTGAVAATLEALKGETKNDITAQAKAKSKGKKPEGMKRPAAKPKKRTNLKRPAAADHVQSSEEESREAKRLRLINAWVPKESKEMQKKYRNGCSKCYYRSGCTLSCWRLRGFEMTD
eukprot:s3420_g6.t1